MKFKKWSLKIRTSNINFRNRHEAFIICLQSIFSVVEIIIELSVIKKLIHVYV